MIVALASSWVILLGLAVLNIILERENRRAKEVGSVFRLYAGRLAALLGSMPDLPPAAVDALADFHAYRRELEDNSE